MSRTPISRPPATPVTGTGSKFSTGRGHLIRGKQILDPRSVDAVRLFLSRTRPEGRRTNFERAGYETLVRDTLIGGWQGWLRDLGERVERRYGGVAPDAGIWTPEHTAFLARLDARLSALAGSLGSDGFSLNRTAEELLGLVEDAIRFSQTEGALAGTPGWQDETRTAVGTARLRGAVRHSVKQQPTRAPLPMLTMPTFGSVVPRTMHPPYPSVLPLTAGSTRKTPQLR
jgi:methionyl-tRNA synthetase